MVELESALLIVAYVIISFAELFHPSRQNLSSTTGIQYSMTCGEQ